MEWISNLQVNLPAGKDGNRYHIPWRRQLMMFREAFHLSLRLQKMKLPFPTIKDPGKVGEQNIYKICTQKNILTPLWKFSLRFVIWNLMIATIKVINERKSHVLPLLILISWRGCCFCFCSDQWYPLCALATGGLFVYRYHFHFVFSVIACLSLQLLFVCRRLIWQLIFCHCLWWQMLLRLPRLCESYLLCLGDSCPVGCFFAQELPAQWNCSLLPEPCISLCQINLIVTRIPSIVKYIN